MANVLVGLVVVWGLYVAAASIILSPWGLGKIFAGSNDVMLDHARAWSVWPGVVHARDIRLRMQDQNVEWVLEMKEADLTIALGALAHRTFHATKVRGAGATFRFRSRILPEDATSPTVAGYPAIPPYDDPPIAQAYVQPPDIPEDEYKLWTIHMEDVDVGVAEAWLHEVRYVARARESRARGAFRLRPAKHLWVGPASLELTPGELTIRGAPLVDPLFGRADVMVWPFDVYEPKGSEVLAFIDVRAALSGEVRDVAALSAYLPPDVRIEDGSGQLKVHLGVKSGVLTADTTVHYETERLRTELPQHVSVEGPLEAWLRVTPDDYEAGRLYARARLLTVHRKDLATPVTVTHLVAEASSTSVAMTGHGELAGARIEVAEARAVDTRWLEWPSLAVGGKPLRARGSSLSLSGGAALSADHLVSGALDVGAVLARLVVVDDAFAGSVRAHARFDHVSPRDVTGSARLTVSGRDLSFERASGLKVATTRLEVDAAANIGRDHGRSARVRVDATGASARASPRLAFKAASASVRATLATARDGTETATITTTVDAARMTLPTASVRGDVGLTVHLSATPAHDHGELTAGLRLTRVALRTKDKSVDDWSAAIDVTGARLDALDHRKATKSHALDGAAAISLRLQDGKPLLAVLRAEDEIPSWLGAVLGGDPVVASGRIHLAKDRLDLVLAKAAEGPLSAKGCVARAHHSLDGALVVALAGTPLTLGLGITRGGVKVAPIVGDDWLARNGGAEAPGAVCGARSHVEQTAEPDPQRARTARAHAAP